jgi:hypothetical protein
MATAVSHGAAFRTLNKEDGPSRKLQSNFGFLQLEEFEKNLPAHRLATPTHNPHNNRKYIYDVLDWVIKKVFDIPYFLFPRSLASSLAVASRKGDSLLTETETSSEKQRAIQISQLPVIRDE